MSLRISVFGHLKNIDLRMVQREEMSLHLPHEFSPLSLDIQEFETFMEKNRSLFPVIYNRTSRVEFPCLLCPVSTARAADRPHPAAHRSIRHQRGHRSGVHLCRATLSAAQAGSVLPPSRQPPDTAGKLLCRAGRSPSSGRSLCSSGEHSVCPWPHQARSRGRGPRRAGCSGLIAISASPATAVRRAVSRLPTAALPSPSRPAEEHNRICDWLSGP